MFLQTALRQARVLSRDLPEPEGFLSGVIG